MTNSISYPKFKAWDYNGVALAGGLLYSYEPHTDTKTDTYSDAALTIPNSNPVVLDSVGEASVYIDGSCKLKLEDANGVLIWTVDDVTPETLWTFSPAEAGVFYSSVLYGGSQSTLVAAIATVGSTEATIYLAPSNWIITANLTIPSNITFKPERGALLVINSGKTLTINGPLDAGSYQIFSGSGSVQFGPGSVQAILPQWFGAKADGATDDSAAIQAAFNSVTLATYYGWRVHFPNGIYYVASAVNLPGLVSDWANGAYTTFFITGDGATLYTDQAISILKRWPPDAVASPNEYANTAFVVDGLTFKGTSLRGQVGLDLACTYGSNITNCRFDYLGRGLRLSYALMARVTNCLSHNCVIAGFTGNAGYGLWNSTGATWHTNTCVYQSCRAYTNGNVNHDIEGISKANPAVVTWTGHGLQTGDIVFIDGITQDAQWDTLNKRRFQIVKLSDNTFSLYTLNRTLAGAAFDSSGFTNAYVPATDPGKIQAAVWSWELIDTFVDNLSACIVEGNTCTDKVFFYSLTNQYNGFSASIHSEGAAAGAEIYLNTNGSVYNFAGLGNLDSPIHLDTFDMSTSNNSTIYLTGYAASLNTNYIRLPADYADCNLNFIVDGLDSLGSDDDFSNPGYWYGGVPATHLAFTTNNGSGTVKSALQFNFLPWYGMFVKQDPNSPYWTSSSYMGLRSAMNANGGGGMGTYDATNGQAIMVKQKSTEITSLSAGATHTWSGGIPAGSLVVGVTARVTQAIAGPTSFTIGDGSTANKFGTGVGVTLAATSDLTKMPAAASPTIYPSATNVVLTATGGTFTGGAGNGKVRITVHYITLEAPGS